jgi:hypothetical protein
MGGNFKVDIGFTQVIVGQPFDTVKVRLQANVEYTSAWDCIVRMYKNEGLSSFFKGIWSVSLKALYPHCSEQGSLFPWKWEGTKSSRRC